MSDADIGLIGLAVMGQNLILNMNDKGYKVVCYNRTVEKVDAFLSGPAKGTNVVGAKSLEEFVGKLKRPRKFVLMVKAGDAVDSFIEKALPYLEKGDIIIDGGNSHYPDTQRRYEMLKEKGLHFVGMGISGGEEGARNGPSMMPGGSTAAWPYIKDIFQSIAATSEGEPCCDWVGEGGAGHFVKMVHNGIEYGDIQLICEVYDLLSRSLDCSQDELAKIFNQWNKSELDSYLIEIAAKVFSHRDSSGDFLLPKILDAAGAKGTGKWTTESALDEGIPLSLIGEAVFARALSAMKEERVDIHKLYNSNSKSVNLIAGDLKEEKVEDFRKALYAAKIISYTQGFMLMREASKRYKWNLNFGSIALMWRGGCIIRSVFLGKIKSAFEHNQNLTSLLMDSFFKEELTKTLPSWRRTAAFGIENAIPLPCLTSGLTFFDGITTDRLPQNLTQALRDFFGAHTFERIDAPRGQFFHEKWLESSGDISSTTYNA